MAIEQAESPTDGRRSAGGRRRLAARLNSFVGRERDLVEARGLLERARLVTLVGSPGVGKTRLARELAASLQSPSIDLAVVELAALADPRLVPRRVAAGFGLVEVPGRSAFDSLCEHLVDRRSILVLDNCEHLIDACAELAESLLLACLELRVLATSRELLRIQGETMWRVPSLAVPEPDVGPGQDATAAIARSPAVALFVDRARAISPDFDLSAATAPVVAQIVRRLDGIPLAIELAAARIDLLSPQQIADRLDRRFDLLTGGSRTALARHRTLRSLVDWSHDLLSDGERTVLRRLSVFAGGWTIEAAEAVCSGDGVERQEVLGHLGQLVAKSLVIASQIAEDAIELSASVRYGMLETFRQYGAEKLRESGEESAVRSRHRDWYLALAERIQWDLRGPDQGRLFNLIETELDNFRGALDWCRAGAIAGDSEATELGFRFGAALNRFWRLRCYWREGRRWMGDFFELAAVPSEMHARALFVAGDLARQQGDFAEARQLHIRALAMARGLGATWPEAFALMQLGMMDVLAGALDSASNRLFEALPLMRRLGETNGTYHVLRWLAELAFKRGDKAEAHLRCGESLTLARQLGDPMQISILLRLLGILAQDRGESSEARRLFGDALAIRRELGNADGVAEILNLLGRLELECGSSDMSVKYLRESLAISWRIGRAPGIFASLDGLAAWAARYGESERALTWAGAAAAYREASGAPRSPAHEAREIWLAPARDALGGDRVAEAWSRGRATPIEDAVTDALGMTAPRSRPERVDLLSAREHEVAALIARGCSNRQIADRLVISKRTVDAHVQRILRRLGCHSRSEIAGWIARKRDGD